MHKRSTKRPRQKNPPRIKAPKPEFTPEEIGQLQRPEIPLHLWREGKALFAAKFEQIAISQVGPEIVRSRGRKEIMASKAKLRVLIANDSQLLDDFQFFTRKLAWQPEVLLQQVLFDCNMMRATAQTVISKEKRQHWPIGQAVLENAFLDISDLASLIGRINGTEFSPAKTLALRSENGARLREEHERYLLKAFRRLPEILCSYGDELRRKTENKSHFWSRQEKSWNKLVTMAREDSVFERIRRQLGRYHSVRLHRLINAARRAQGLSSVQYRAFLVWLNRLRNRCERAIRLRDFVARHRNEKIMVRHEGESGRTETIQVAATTDNSAVARLIQNAVHVCIDGRWYSKLEFERLFIDAPNASS